MLLQPQRSSIDTAALFRDTDYVRRRPFVFRTEVTGLDGVLVVG